MLISFPAIVRCFLRNICSHNYPTGGNNSVAFTLAHKIIDKTAGNPSYLVAIIVKGTSSNGEWYGNFNIGTNDSHTGFVLAKDELMGVLKTYLTKHGLNGTNSKYLVTGHSRGAAVANLVAAELTQSSLGRKSSVYGYTFATPTVSVNATKSGYENIFNIISGEDFITQIPLGKWNYNHYGIDLLLPSKSYYPNKEYTVVSEKMAATYSDTVHKDFVFYENGVQDVDKLLSTVYKLAPTVNDFYTLKHFWDYSLLTRNTTTFEYFNSLVPVIVDKGLGNYIGFAQTELGDFRPITNFFIINHALNKRVFSAHSMAGYYSWLDSCTAEELFGDMNRRTTVIFKRIQIACPVNVYVYDENRNLVASVVNEEIREDSLAISVEEGIKTIDLPSGQDYSIKIKATDEGAVEYIVEEWSAQATGNSVLRTVSFNPIDIKDGDELTGNVNDDLYTNSNNYALTKNEGNIIYPDSDSLNPSPNIPSTPSGGGDSSDSDPTYSIMVPSRVTGGTVKVTPTSASEGQRVTLTVKANYGYELAKLTVTDSKGAEIALTDQGDGKYTFTMPKGNVSVDAQFQRIESSVTPVQPVSVNPTNDKLEVDGKPQTPAAYKINDYNYFKLRDIAALLNGTGKQFSVGYESSTGEVSLTSGQPYEVTDADLTALPAESRQATISTNVIYINGVRTQLTVYLIDGYNYFKLRDLASALDFYVGWTADRGMFLESDKPYSA